MKILERDAKYYKVITNKYKVWKKEPGWLWDREREEEELKEEKIEINPNKNTSSPFIISGCFGTFTWDDIKPSYEKLLYLFGDALQTWLFRDKIYEVYNNKYDKEKVSLLILERADKERKKFERLKEKYLTHTSKDGKDTEKDYRKIPEM